MPDILSTVLLVVFTCMLAVANIYGKTVARVPELFELRLRVFLNLAFALYAAICILFAFLAYMYFQSKIPNGFVLIVLAGLVGVRQHRNQVCRTRSPTSSPLGSKIGSHGGYYDCQTNG
jgi:hypothetical protein